ncbi:hypothetical protein PWT90_00626 [Aphanocladium album]|nr:hypothetical protein PWT90_00626 [Aphanocladium album]
MADGNHGALVLLRLCGRRPDPRDRRPAAQRLGARGHGASLDDHVVKGELPVRVRLDGGLLGGESFILDMFSTSSSSSLPKPRSRIVKKPYRPAMNAAAFHPSGSLAATASCEWSPSRVLRLSGLLISGSDAASAANLGRSSCARIRLTKRDARGVLRMPYTREIWQMSVPTLSGSGNARSGFMLTSVRVDS